MLAVRIKRPGPERERLGPRSSGGHEPRLIIDVIQFRLDVALVAGGQGAEDWPRNRIAEEDGVPVREDHVETAAVEAERLAVRAAVVPLPRAGVAGVRVGGGVGAGGAGTDAALGESG